jgi:hypothetical protein
MMGSTFTESAGEAATRRDMLLPKLVPAELRVKMKDVEPFVGRRL